MDKGYFAKSMDRMRLSLIFMSLMLMTICGCGQSGGRAAVNIKTQPTGMASGDIIISVDVANFELVDVAGNQNGSGTGYIIYYLDVPVPTYYEHSAASEAGTYAITSDTAYTWKNVSPGEHIFAVQLVNQNDSPLPAPVVDSMTVNVGPPVGTPEILIMSPPDGSSVPPGNVSVSLNVNNFVISQKNMGVINRTGEGHLIYYIDDNPPIDPGIPAVTDTSIVSVELTHLWKTVMAGQHTFAVQLVNNDDTPLQTPILKVVSINVGP